MPNQSHPTCDKILNILRGENFYDDCDDIFNTYFTYIQSEDGILKFISLYFFAITLGEVVLIIRISGYNNQMAGDNHSVNDEKYAKYEKSSILEFYIEQLSGYFCEYHKSLKQQKESSFNKMTEHGKNSEIRAKNAVNFLKEEFIKKYKEIFKFIFDPVPLSDMLKKIKIQDFLYSFFSDIAYLMECFKESKKNKKTQERRISLPLQMPKCQHHMIYGLEAIQLLFNEESNKTFEDFFLSNYHKISVLYYTLKEFREKNHNYEMLHTKFSDNIKIISDAANYVAPPGEDPNALAYITSSYLTALSLKKHKLFISSVDETKNAQYYNDILKGIVSPKKMQDVLNALSNETINYLKQHYPNEDYAMMAKAIKIDLIERSKSLTQTECMNITAISDQTFSKKEICTASLESAFDNTTLQPQN